MNPVHFIIYTGWFSAGKNVSFSVFHNWLVVFHGHISKGLIFLELI